MPADSAAGVSLTWPRLGFSCVSVHSQQHVLVMCAAAFYLIENYPLDVGPDFSASIIQVSQAGLGCALRLGAGLAEAPTREEAGRPFDPEAFPPVQMCGVMLSGSEEATPSVVYHCVLRGLERLLLSEQLSRLDAESLVKLSVDRVNVHSPHRAMAALGLMLTCMYTGEPGTRVPLGSRRRASAGASSSLGHQAAWGQSPVWERLSV